MILGVKAGEIPLKKHPDFHKKYFNRKNTDKASEIKASGVVE